MFNRSLKASTHPNAIWILVALILLAFNLRSPLTALPPVINLIRSDFSINAATAGLLTSIPIFCFGLLTPPAGLLIARFGINKSIFIALAGSAIGLAIRPLGDFTQAIWGTLILGASLTIGNIVSLMVIARDFPRRNRTVTGIYTAALNLGTMITSALTAPLTLWLGWRLSLIFWLILPALAASCWLWALMNSPAKVENDSTLGSAPLTRHLTDPLQHNTLRKPIVWLLGSAFVCHLFIYYSLTAWLPSYLIDANHMSSMSAGMAASLFQLMALFGAFLYPVFCNHFSSSSLLASVGIIWIVMPLGLLFSPGSWLFWSFLAGFAQGGGFVMIFNLIVEYSTNLDENRRISSAVQGIGYTGSACGPFLMGHLHELTGNWSYPLLIMSSIAILIVLSGSAIHKLEKKRKNQLVSEH
jgi:CP family cyanate transporter-like MFS transporter